MLYENFLFSSDKFITEQIIETISFMYLTESPFVSIAVLLIFIFDFTKASMSADFISLIFSSENLSKGEFSVSIDGKDVVTGKIEDTITMVNYSENGFFILWYNIRK